MWLAKDERRLLKGYFHVFGDIDRKETYRLGDLAPLLDRKVVYSKIRRYDESDGASSPPADLDSRKNEAIKYITDSRRIRVANKVLEKRGLITVKDHDLAVDVIIIALTVDGFNLGRRYSSWLVRSGLWFQEYKNHWIWLKSLRFWAV